MSTWRREVFQLVCMFYLNDLFANRNTQDGNFFIFQDYAPLGSRPGIIISSVCIRSAAHCNYFLFFLLFSGGNECFKQMHWNCITRHFTLDLRVTIVHFYFSTGAKRIIVFDSFFSCSNVGKISFHTRARVVNSAWVQNFNEFGRIILLYNCK